SAPWHGRNCIQIHNVHVPSYYVDTMFYKSGARFKTTLPGAYETKNSDTRIIPLSRVAINVLLSLKRTASPKVFNLSKNSLTSAWGAAKKRARDQYIADCNEKNVIPQNGYITDLRWHDLRHEGTSRLFEHGLNLMEVASVTGHKTLAMLRNYTHLKAQNLAQKLDRAANPELSGSSQNES
ncbi:tyrosine-type recombinase/integrase, partial [Undibacterium sp. SXout7W]|uniref:tyrosine-type recombinase/integrase n=1 Tax=Undibacterium sp. SXout7W TaxID=3413049 RepID=UPI003BF3614F